LLLLFINSKITLYPNSMFSITHSLILLKVSKIVFHVYDDCCCV